MCNAVNEVPDEFRERIEPAVRRVAQAHRLIVGGNVKDARDNIRVAGQEVEKALNSIGAVSDDVAEGAREVLETTLSEMNRLLRCLDDYMSLDERCERAQQQCALYGESTRRMREGGIASGAEYWAEMIEFESSYNYAASLMDQRNRLPAQLDELCDKLERDLIKLRPTSDLRSDTTQEALRRGERIGTVSPFVTQRINELHSLLREVYGDEYGGGRVLSDLADVLYDAGEYREALGRYEASLGHLERTSQWDRIPHVRSRIEELKRELTSERK